MLRNKRFLEVDNVPSCTIPEQIVYPKLISVLFEKMKSTVVVGLDSLKFLERLLHFLRQAGS